MFSLDPRFSDKFRSQQSLGLSVSILSPGSAKALSGSRKALSDSRRAMIRPETTDLKHDLVQAIEAWPSLPNTEYYQNAVNCQPCKDKGLLS